MNSASSSKSCRRACIAPLCAVLLLGIVHYATSFAPSQIASAAFGQASRTIRLALQQQQQQRYYSLGPSSLSASPEGSESSQPEDEFDGNDQGNEEPPMYPAPPSQYLSSAMRVGNQKLEGQTNKVPPMIRSQEELEALVQKFGYPRSRAQLIWSLWTNSQGGVEAQIDTMISMPDPLRNQLKQQFAPEALAGKPVVSGTRAFRPAPIPIRSRGELENIVSSWGYPTRQATRIWMQWEQIVEATNEGDIQRSADIAAQLARDVTMMSSLPEKLRTKIISQFASVPVPTQGENEARVKEELAAAAAAEQARLEAELEEARIAEEERLAEEARVAEEMRLAEEMAAEAARLKAEEEARLEAEAEAKRIAEEKAAEDAVRAEEEARVRAEEEARLKAEEEARLKAEEEARIKAEEEARIKAEEEARLKAEAEAEAKRIAEEKAAEEARLKAEAEAKRIAEEKAAEEARLKAEAEAEAKRIAEEKAAEEARLKAEAEAEAKRLAEEKAAEEARLKAEAEAEAKRQAEEKAAEEARLKAEEEAKRIAAEKAAEEKRLAEEKAAAEAKAAEEKRIAEEKAAAEAKAAEEKRIAEEKAAAEAKAAEEKRIAEEKAAAEAKAAEEKRVAEEKAAAEAKAAEEKRIAEEKAAEEARLQAEKEAAAAAEEARLAEEQRIAEEKAAEGKGEETLVAEEILNFLDEEERKILAMLSPQELQRRMATAEAMLAEGTKAEDEATDEASEVMADEEELEDAALIAAEAIELANEYMRQAEAYQATKDQLISEAEAGGGDEKSLADKAVKLAIDFMNQAANFGKRVGVLVAQAGDKMFEKPIAADALKRANELVTQAQNYASMIGTLADNIDSSDVSDSDLDAEASIADQGVQLANELISGARKVENVDGTSSAIKADKKAGTTREDIAAFFENFVIKVVIPVEDVSPNAQKEATCNVRLSHIVDDDGYVSYEQLMLLTSMFVASITNNSDDAQLEERDGDYYLSLDGTNNDANVVKLEYVDTDSDVITVASTKELLDAMELFHDQQSLRLVVRFIAAETGRPPIRSMRTTTKPGVKPMGTTTVAKTGVQPMRGGTVGASLRPMEIAANTRPSTPASVASRAASNDSAAATAETPTSDPAAATAPPLVSPPEQAAPSATVSDSQAEVDTSSTKDATVSKTEEPASAKMINSLFNALGTGLEAVEAGLKLIPKNPKGKAKQKSREEQTAVAKPPTANVVKEAPSAPKRDSTKSKSIPHFASVSSGVRNSPPVPSSPEAAFTISENKRVPAPAFGLPQVDSEMAMTPQAPQSPPPQEKLEDDADLNLDEIDTYFADDVDAENLPNNDEIPLADEVLATQETDTETYTETDTKDVSVEDVEAEIPTAEEAEAEIPTILDTNADDSMTQELDISEELIGGSDMSQPIRSRKELQKLLQSYGYPKNLGTQIWDQGVRTMMEQGRINLARKGNKPIGGELEKIVEDLERQIDALANLPQEIRDKLKRKFL